MNLKRFGINAALCFCVLAASHSVAAAPKMDPVVAVWNRRLEQAKEALKVGDWKRARNLSRGVLDQMCDQIVDGEDVNKALALTLTLLALGEAGSGEEAAGVWHWHVAKQLFPEFGQIDLALFGAPGQRLLAEELVVWSSDKSAETQPEVLALNENIRPPKKKRAPLPKYPEAMRRTGREVLVILAMVIDQQGRVSNPQILKSDGAPTMVLASLEAVRRWQFEPALLDGKPVKVFYTLTINFELSG